jgi:lipopolysaccharide/colanic/teichoic acid biosynthesis glycosyltransferase
VLTDGQQRPGETRTQSGAWPPFAVEDRGRHPDGHTPAFFDRRNPGVPGCTGYAPAAGIATRALKRSLDVVLAGTALVLAAPLILLIAVLIVLESPGPVLYRAERVGYRGRPLRMAKFRKMRVGARGAALTAAGDPRFTRVGSWLARTRLDELPQLWHVVRGEMSLVGPRPEHFGFVVRHARDYGRILSVRPGLTGLSQLAFAREREVLDDADPLDHYVTRLLPQKIGLDRLYAATLTVRGDLSVLVGTLATLVLGQSIAVDRRSGRLTRRHRPSEPA